GRACVEARPVSPARRGASDSLLARIFAMPAHRLPVRVLADPLGDVGLGSGRALLQRPIERELEMSVFAFSRMCGGAYGQNQFNQAHRCLRYLLHQRATTNKVQVARKISPLPSTAMSPAKRRNERCRSRAARAL